MTIKELATLANVSISTVSKVLNDKDSSISHETRERILQLARQYNYIPYSKACKATGHSGVIGVVLSEGTSDLNISSAIALVARSSGYSTLFSPYSSGELSNIPELMRSHGVEGVIYEDIEALSEAKFDMPAVKLSVNNSKSNDCISVSYSELGYAATQRLIEAHHQQIVCITNDNTNNSSAFMQGFKQCLFDNKIPYYATMHYSWPPTQSHDISFIAYNYTAAVCISSDIAVSVFAGISSLNIHIPKDFSIISIKRDCDTIATIPPLTSISLPIHSIGELACHTLINRIHSKMDPLINLDYCINGGESIDIPSTMRNKKIIVVGTINMDVILNVNRFPDSGATIIVDKRMNIPGGKGLNQALMSARLGAETHLIGRIGKDYDGFSLSDFMKANHLNMEGILSDDNAETGKAYITVQNGGESSILVFSGANKNISEANISMHEQLFENASFCLLNTELPCHITEYAAELACRHNVRTILKPCDVSELSDSLLEKIDILLPNKKEANLLLPYLKTEEEKADYFLAKGVKTVIITLGHKGCYIKDSEHSKYFPAAPFDPIDTTGAADAFAATLAVYLSRNYPIDSAITYSTFAAGFCITHQGVTPGLIDQNTLEYYVTYKK